MTSGIRVTVAFSGPAECPLAELSARAKTIIDTVSNSVATESTTCVSEFLVDPGSVPEVVAAEPVFAYESKTLYRLSHDSGDPCPCECLGEFGRPIERYFAQDGELTLVFHAADFEQLQAIFGELRARYDGLDPKRLVRAPTDGVFRDTVFVDRGKLTDRQFEVLQMAYARGYFEQPRETNAEAIAAELGIDPSTFSEHLAAAHSKLLEDVLEEGV